MPLRLFLSMLPRTLGLALCLLSCALPARAVPPATAAIDTLVRQEMAARKIPGLQLAIVRHGQIIFHGNYGVANIATGQPVRDDTRFAINSISKAFVGVAAMQLVEADQLRLDTPVSRYLPDLPPAWDAITARQLLSHLSGLAEVVDDNLHPLGGGDLAQAWHRVTQMPLRFTPGSQFLYTQTNYMLLAQLIDARAQQDFTRFIAERQFATAAMTDTGFGGQAVASSTDAPSYTYLHLLIRDGQTVGVRPQAQPILRHEPMPGTLAAAGGIHSNATDLARWVIALQSGKLLAQSQRLAQLWTATPLRDGQIVGLDDVANGYALGWPLVRRARHPAFAPEGGERAALFIYPDDDLSVIVLTNLMGASPQTFIDRIAALVEPDWSTPIHRSTTKSPGNASMDIGDGRSRKRRIVPPFAPHKPSAS